MSSDDRVPAFACGRRWILPVNFTARGVVLLPWWDLSSALGTVGSLLAAEQGKVPNALPLGGTWHVGAGVYIVGAYTGPSVGACSAYSAYIDL